MTTDREPPAKGRPGGVPSVTAVIKFLKAAGFQHSRYTEAVSAPTGFGAYVRQHGPGEVSVSHREGDRSFFERMNKLGVTDVTDVPDDPEGPTRAQEYADALAPRYTVRIVGTSVYVRVRPELPARPKGVPRAPEVRTALIDAGITTSRGERDPFTVVDQPDHTRVAVGDEEAAEGIAKALRAQGWTFERFETIGHYGFTITGSTPDRRARLAELRHNRALNNALAKVRADGAVEGYPAPSEATTAPAPEPTGPAYGEPTPEDELRDGDTVMNVHTGAQGIWKGFGMGSYLVKVMGSSYAHTGAGCWRFLSRPEPAEPATALAGASAEPEVPMDQEAPLTHAYGPGGTRYEPGMRVTLRASDGLWNHGEVTEVYAAAHTRKPHVRFMVDAYQAAPPRRRQKWMDNKPGKRRSTSRPHPIVAAVADKDLSPEIIA
jgi:hypothetical protein